MSENTIEKTLAPDMTEEVIGAEVKEEPAAVEVQEEPAAAEVQEEPAAAEVKEEPAAAEEKAEKAEAKEETPQAEASAETEAPAKKKKKKTTEKTEGAEEPVKKKKKKKTTDEKDGAEPAKKKKKKKSTKKKLPDTREDAITVEDLSVHFKSLQKFSIKQGLFTLGRKKADVFEAVKHVSFTVKKGEILGIVGKNGSGKSTMLRAIAGIFSPNSGTIDLHGNTISLLSIGVGFQSELSGRENILLSGMLLGFSEEQIREKAEEIIEFSELGAFIDAPVRTYSSGMYSKLAFSITAILETDIILIDEVLSVGDSRFRKKSYKKMKELISNLDRTVLIVSHDSKTINKLCTSVLWINDGELKMMGKTKKVMAAYEEFMA